MTSDKHMADDFADRKRQQLELAEQVLARGKTGPFEWGGKVLTNVEMSALHAHRQYHHRQRLETQLCCGGEMTPSGTCYQHGGRCPAWELARRSFHGD